MEYDFYTLGVLYLVYSFAGWVGETVVATVRGKHFANRGAAAGPFCFSSSCSQPNGHKKPQMNRPSSTPSRIRMPVI